MALFRYILTAILTLCVITSVSSQSVGLVMSGGGAKGIAHIGVIKALEENEIPIDYVTGTSMGAIVAGLYAMGYTPEEMMDLIKSEQFKSWSTGKISHNRQYFFRKDFPNPRFTSLHMGIEEGEKKITPHFLPTSLISPIPMNYGFLQLYSAATAQSKGNFDNLFVPFRAVASDVYNKLAVVFRNGDLGDAIRASMTFPFVFKPIEKDSVLLYDGGIYNNFPIDVMREDFAPDFIVGSKVASNPGKPAENDLMTQIESMVMQKTDYNVKPEEGVLISFKLDEIVSLLDFHKADSIYKMGYEKGIAFADSIKKRVDRRVPLKAKNLQRMAWRSNTPELIFDEAEVRGGNNGQNNYIGRQFDVERDCTEHLNIEGVENAYYKLMSGNKISEITPHAVFNDSSGMFKLTLDVKLKDKFELGLGGYISSGNTNMLYLDAKYSTLNFYSLDVMVNGYVGRGYNSGMISAKIELPTKTPMYLMGFGVYSKKKFYESERLFVQSESPTFISNQEAFFKLRLGLPFLTSSKAEISAGYGYLVDTFYPSNVLEYATTPNDKSNYSMFMGSVKFEYNTTERSMYPTKGSFVSLVGEIVSCKEDFEPAIPQTEEYNDKHSWLSMRTTAHRYYNVHKNFTLGIMGDLLLSSKNFYATYNSTIIQAPSFSPTPHSKTVFNEGFRANQFVAAGIIPIYHIIRNLQLRGDFYCFCPFFKIEQSPTDINKPVYGKFMRNPEFMGELTLAYNLPFASIGVFTNYYSYPKNDWNFGINFGFLIFNPKFLN